MDFVPFIVIGLVSGSVYGLAGVGLVLTYKTSGTFTFAYGAIAAGAAFVFYFLRVDQGIPWPIAAVLSVLVLGPALGVAFELLARRLAEVGPAWRVLATIGIVLAVQAGATIWYGTNVRLYPAFLPTDTVRI